MGRLAPLRRNLDFMPSPLQDRPGLLIRDPCRFADGLVVIPDPLLPVLRFFDGGHTRDELLQALEGAPPEDAAALVDHVTRTLGDGGFLDDATYARLRSERIQAFREAPVREPAHVGGAYPAAPDALRHQVGRWMAGRPAAPEQAILGLAAPHVSPEGGWRSYADAYAALPSSGTPRTFVILGTSHYGEPDRFAVTRKPFLTPYGRAAVDVEVVDALEAGGGPGVLVEDYTHAVEHSIEFQVLFLQHLYGQDLHIVPVLCGPFGRSMTSGYPEDDPAVGRVIETLGALHGLRPDLAFVLGVDLAHIGRRYGDAEPARAHQGPMNEVAARDAERLARLAAGDAHGFWDLVRDGGDDPLRWCGSSPLYALARALPGARAEVLRYEQWNIDDESVVSFAALAFRRAAAAQ